MRRFVARSCPCPDPHQVNVNSIPYNRRQGDEPALTDADVDAIVAFLGTLTDAAYRH